MQKEYIKLSKRLQLIANKVPVDTRVADIGTDHAYIPIYLIQNNISKKVIASDVRKGPVEIAKENIRKYKLQDKIEVRLGNGLERIKNGEVDTVIIAGMGGVLITQILSAAQFVLETVDTLILQPMVGQEEVRKWLAENEYRIIDEELIDEEKIYNVIVAQRGHEIIDNKIYYHIGKRLIEKNDPLLEELITREVNKINNIIDNLKNSKLKDAPKKLIEYEEILYEYERIL